MFSCYVLLLRSVLDLFEECLGPCVTFGHIVFIKGTGPFNKKRVVVGGVLGCFLSLFVYGVFCCLGVVKNNKTNNEFWDVF